MSATREKFEAWFADLGKLTPDQERAQAAVSKAHADADDLLSRLAKLDPVLTCDVDAVNGALFALALAIETNAPESADKSAAIRCVRLARMAALEFISARQADPAEKPRTGLTTMALWEIDKARWQANSAIALDGK
jgi:hypothetical protein